MADLRGVKVGDTVFVVEQNGRPRNRHGEPRRTSFRGITKVGRKYAYFQRGNAQEKFDRITGESNHESDSNARSNGRGFDVYLSEGDYVREQHEKSELKRLSDRMCARYGGLFELSPSVVDSIHAILDAEGLD